MRVDSRWSRTLSDGLGMRARLALTERPLDPGRLTRGERAQLEGVAEHGRDQWLLGRAALKALIPETSAVRFPSARFSLSHSGGVAVAVEAEDAGGVGVDLELEASPGVAAARFFLSPVEQAWVLALPAPEHASALRRLWTVKEALFKADLENGQRILADYTLAEPFACSGLASGPNGRLRYISFSLPLDQGALSVAIAPVRTPSDTRGAVG